MKTQVTVPSKSTDKLALLLDFAAHMDKDVLMRVSRVELQWEAIGSDPKRETVVPRVVVEFKD